MNHIFTQNFKNTGQQPTKLSVNDFILKAAALSLRDVPEANVLYQNDGIKAVKYVFVRTHTHIPRSLHSRARSHCLVTNYRSVK